MSMVALLTYFYFNMELIIGILELLPVFLRCIFGIGICHWNNVILTPSLLVDGKISQMMIPSWCDITSPLC